MTISIPGSKKRGLAGLLGRKKPETVVAPAAKKQLQGSQVAKLFDKREREKKPLRPAKLNANEKHDRAQLSSLRGALYSDK